jgi:Carbohydrate binding module (family 35)
MLVKVGLAGIVSVGGLVGAAGPSPAQTTCSSSGWPFVEAECAVLSGPIAVESAPSASGGKELGGWDYGGTATVTLAAPAAGPYLLEVEASAPYGSALRTVVVNGVSRTFGVFAGGRAKFAVGVLDLVAGNNVVVFKRLTGDDNVANLDKISVLGATPTTTTPTTTAPPTTAPPTTAPPTTAPPVAGCATGSLTIEAECAVLSGPIAIELNPAASGGKLVGGWQAGGSVTFNFIAPLSGYYRIIARASAPYGPAKRTVRGSSSSFLAAYPFQISSGVLADTSVITNIGLSAGPNTLTFALPTNDWGVVNLDRITILPPVLPGEVNGSMVINGDAAKLFATGSGQVEVRCSFPFSIYDRIFTAFSATNQTFKYTGAGAECSFVVYSAWPYTIRDSYGDPTDGLVLMNGSQTIEFTFNEPNVPTTTVTTVPPTTAPPTTVAPSGCSAGWPSVEAECAVLSGPIVVERNTAASGGKELGGWQEGGTATLTLTAPAARIYSLDVSVYAPFGAGFRQVRINGGPAISIVVASAGRSIVTIPNIQLTAGANTVVFSRTDGGGTGNAINLDKVAAR